MIIRLSLFFFPYCFSEEIRYPFQFQTNFKTIIWNFVISIRFILINLQSNIFC